MHHGHLKGSHLNVGSTLQITYLPQKLKTSNGQQLLDHPLKIDRNQFPIVRCNKNNSHIFHVPA